MQLYKEVEDKPMQNKNEFMDRYINSFMNKFSPVDMCIPYSGKLLREKTFANFEVLWLLMKVFSANFGGVASVGGRSNPRVFSAQIIFFTILREFSPSKVFSISKTYCLRLLHF